MSTSEIFEKLNLIFNKVLDPDSPLTIEESTTADDVDDWDSLAHIQLIIAIENEFNVKFNSREIESFFNVGDIVKSLQGKQ